MNKLLLIVFFLINCAYSANAAPLDKNLVINGGAETGNTNGWISSGIDAVPATGLAAGFGSYVFTGGTGPDSQTLTQTIDVSGNSVEIDAGEIESTFNVNLQSRTVGSVVDLAKANVFFLDATGIELGSFSFVDTINPLLMDWNLFSDTRILPRTTRSIRILLTSVRTSGGISSDGFIDDVSLSLTNVHAKSIAIKKAWITPTKAKQGEYIKILAQISGDPSKISEVVFMLGSTPLATLTDPDGDGTWTGQHQIIENLGYQAATKIYVKNLTGGIIAKWPGFTVLP